MVDFIEPRQARNRADFAFTARRRPKEKTWTDPRYT